MPPDTTPGDPAIAEPAAARARWLGQLYTLYVLLRTAAWVAAAGATVLLVSALVGAVTAAPAGRLTAGLLVALLIPVLLRGWLRGRVARRLGRRPQLGGGWFVVGWNVLLLGGLCLGFSDDVGRSLRRRGDWFLGRAEGWFPRQYRQGLTRTSRWLERFDLPPEARGVLAEAVLQRHQLREPGVALPTGTGRWYHPLSGPSRSMPPNSATRFGAHRPGHRPRECQLGHCGVDLFRPAGAPVFAVHDGVVQALQRDAAAGGIAGKFVWLKHKGGKVISSYVHLRDISPRLTVGARVRGGEAIGSLGRTGIRRSSPHLHFAVAVRSAGRKQYIDPEPMLSGWRLPTRGAVTARR